MHRPPLSIDDCGIAIDQLRNRSSNCRFRGLKCLNLPSNFIRMPDIILIGQQNIIDLRLQCLLKKPREISLSLPGVARHLRLNDDPSIGLRGR